MSGFRCQFCKGSLMKVHYPKLYNMAHLSLNVFTASKGSNNYILSIFFNIFHMLSYVLYQFSKMSRFNELNKRC